MALALDGAEGTAVGPCLRVDPANLSGLARLAGDTPRWRAQPGVPLAVLAQAGLRQFDGLPGAMTLAEWLAAPAAWPAGRCAQSGVLAADVVLADGVEKPWGLLARATNGAALGHAAAAGAGAVPAEHGAGRRRLRRGGAWAGRYRLDARPQAPATVNLAHLLLGHGGTLAWVQEVLLTAVPAAGEAAGGDAPPLDDAAREAGRRLDARIKALFDPDGRFPYSLSRNSGGPRAAGKMGWPAGAGWRTGAARARNHIAPAAVGIEFPLSCTSTCFSPIPWMPIFAKPPSNITSSGAPAKSPSPHQAADQPARPGAGLFARRGGGL